MDLVAVPVVTTSSNREAGATVVNYYDHCRNDYRILWRTDENGSIHYGFFDRAPDLTLGVRASEWIRAVPMYAVGIAAVLGAVGVAATGTAWGQERAVRWLRVAARGRASRHDAAQRKMTQVCADAVGLRPGERVLDAGCGVGGTSLWLASQRGVSVFGLNLQEAQLNEARARVARDPGGAGVRFSAQDYTAMGVADSSIDVVWALESICHCLDKRAFLREAYRVLRPGGQLMVADFLLPDKVRGPRDEQAMRTWTRGWAIPNLATVSSFAGSLEAEGFTNIRYRDIREHVLPSARRLYKASLIALPVDWVLQRAGARSGIQRENIRGAYWQYLTLRAGAWTYGIFVAAK